MSLADKDKAAKWDNTQGNALTLEGELSPNRRFTYIPWGVKASLLIMNIHPNAYFSYSNLTFTKYEFPQTITIHLYGFLTMDTQMSPNLSLSVALIDNFTIRK